MAWSNVVGMLGCSAAVVGVAWALAWMVVRVNGNREAK